MGGVWFEGPLEMGFAVCLHARVAMRVLLELARFPAADADELYAGARAVDWSPWLTARTTLAVSADVSDNPALHHSGFAALKVKDAVVDAPPRRARRAPQRRPARPRRRHPAARARRGEGACSWIWPGEPLHRRGYRVAMTDAPLKETLAAAVLALGRVDPELPFVDPMCGSGTLAIEQALAARRIAPGLRRRFGFQRWPPGAERAGAPGLGAAGGGGTRRRAARGAGPHRVRRSLPRRASRRRARTRPPPASRATSRSSLARRAT